jgi:hypothetical protein
MSNIKRFDPWKRLATLLVWLKQSVLNALGYRLAAECPAKNAAAQGELVLVETGPGATCDMGHMEWPAWMDDMVRETGVVCSYVVWSQRRQRYMHIVVFSNGKHMAFKRVRSGVPLAYVEA